MKNCCLLEISNSANSKLHHRLFYKSIDAVVKDDSVDEVETFVQSIRFCDFHRDYYICIFFGSEGCGD